MIQPTTAGGSTQSTTAATTAALGKDEFLKLLVGQLRNQNPLNPMGDQDFIGQMTQMSMLEQVTNLSASSHALQASTEVSQSLALIGRTVTFARADGTRGEGVVERVSFGEGGVPTLTVGGEEGISPAVVSEVR